MTYSFTTYNLFKAHFPFSRQNVGRMCKENSFVALQEWIDNLHIHKGAYIETNPTFTIPLRHVKTGTATISHHKATVVKKFFSKSRELGCATRKSMLKTIYEVEGKQLAVLNCHALNFVTNRTWKKTIDHWVLQIPLSGSVIFAGDFNTWNRARFDYLVRRLHSFGLQYADYDQKPIMKLDHIWYRDLDVLTCISDENMHSSDHYPVTIHFTLK